MSGMSLFSAFSTMTWSTHAPQQQEVDPQPPTSAFAPPGSLWPLLMQWDWPYRDPVWVLVANAGSLGLALLCRAYTISRGHIADQCQDAPRAGEDVTSQPRMLLSSTDRGITKRMLILETTGLCGHPVSAWIFRGPQDTCEQLGRLVCGMRTPASGSGKSQRPQGKKLAGDGLPGREGHPK